MKFKNYDEYIEKSQDFAQPILKEIRSVVHEACPQVKEEFKWSFPNFTYKGSILCFMASFKQHVSFGFWLGPIMDDPEKLLIARGTESMGNFGKLTSVNDLPERSVFIRYIRHAADLIDQGKKLPAKKTGDKKDLQVPKELLDALSKSDKAKATFEAFSYSHQKEYSQWIEEAKTGATKEKRAAQAIEWMEEGKPRNWKYMK